VLPGGFLLSLRGSLQSVCYGTAMFAAAADVSPSMTCPVLGLLVSICSMENSDHLVVTGWHSASVT